MQESRRSRRWLEVLDYTRKSEQVETRVPRQPGSIEPSKSRSLSICSVEKGTKGARLKSWWFVEGTNIRFWSKLQFESVV